MAEMVMIFCYDIERVRVRRRVAALLEAEAVRVQKSVFEVRMDPDRAARSPGPVAPVLARLADPAATVSVDDLFPLWREAVLTLTCPRPPDFDTGPSLSGRLRGTLGDALRGRPALARTLPSAFDLLYRRDDTTKYLREWPRPYLVTGEAAEGGRAVLIRLRVFGWLVGWVEDLEDALTAGMAGAGVSITPGAHVRARPRPQARALDRVEGLPPCSPALDGGPATAVLRFDTPLVLEREGAVRLDGGALVRSVIRRVAGLAAWMDLAVAGAEGAANGGATADAGPAPAAGPALSALADAVEADFGDQRADGWTRWSRAQDNRPISMTGVVGPVRLRGPLGPLPPWLHLGQRCHAGRRAAFGLGRYTLEDVGE